MKLHLAIKLLTALLLLTSADCLLYGQPINQKHDFPTYQQIKSRDKEIIDYVYVSPDGTSTTIRRGVRFNLFDYPNETVTYVLNGQSTTDAKYVKQILADKRIQIESISISPSSEDRKRTIRISYELVQE